MAHTMVYLGIYLMGTWKECVKCSINVNRILMVDGVVELFIFLVIFCLVILSLVARRVLIVICLFLFLVPSVLLLSFDC